MQRSCIMNLVSFLLLAAMIASSPLASYGADVVLSWDQNPEEELAGYNVYYGTSSRTYFDNVFKLPKESLVEADGRVSYEFSEPLMPNMTYYFAITAYDSSGYETDFSNEVQFPWPEGGIDTSVIINNNDIVTYSRNVILTLSATYNDKELGVDGLMALSNDNREWSEPEAYATGKIWTLSPGEGIKTVYVKFSDAAGNWMAEPAQDQIIYEESEGSCDNPQKLQPASKEASSQFLPLYSIDNAFDENPTTAWSTFSFFKREEFIMLDLGELKRISSFNMYASKLFGTDYFPTNFQIQVSRDNITWASVNTLQGYVPPIEYPYADSWNLNNLACRYIRVYITKAKKIFFFFQVAQIAEIEVYGCDGEDDVPVLAEGDSYLQADGEEGRSMRSVDKKTDYSKKAPTVPGRPEISFQ
jgi:hypothetical protein